MPDCVKNNDEQSYLNISFSKKIDKIVRPKLGEFQLAGDSIFVRFSHKILQQSPHVSDGTAFLGYCVSGQRINQLRKRIKNNEYMLTKDILLLIGTNDVICGRTIPTMKRHFEKLMRLLRIRCVTKITILTVPPVPRLALMRSHWERIHAFNEFLLSLNNPADKVRVVDTLPIYIKEKVPAIRPSLFINKRKLEWLHENEKEGPRKAIKQSLSSDEEEESSEDDSCLSPFGRYLNRVNREERMMEIESSDDNESDQQIKPFIDYRFWNTIKCQLPILNSDSGSSSSRSPVNEGVSQSSSSSLTSPTVHSSSPAKSTPSPDTLSELHKRIIEYTGTFLRLDYFEIYFYGGKRMDMIHPNYYGLKQLKQHLIHSEVL